MKAEFIGGPKDGYRSTRDKMPYSVLFVSGEEDHMIAVNTKVEEGSLDGIPCACYELSAVGPGVVEYEYKMSFI